MGKSLSRPMREVLSALGRGAIYVEGWAGTRLLIEGSAPNPPRYVACSTFDALKRRGLVAEDHSLTTRDAWYFWVLTGTGRAALAALCLLLALAIPAHAGEDAYFTMDLKALALAAPADRLHAHLCVTGTVSQVKHEKDDDWHVRLCDSGLCIVLEIVPDIPVSRPAKGSRITACGIERWDSWHGWRELHPLSFWKPAP